MQTTTISDFRSNIKKYLDSVAENFDTLIINRGKGSGVVIMSWKNMFRWKQQGMNCLPGKMSKDLMPPLKS